MWDRAAIMKVKTRSTFAFVAVLLFLSHEPASGETVTGTTQILSMPSTIEANGSHGVQLRLSSSQSVYHASQDVRITLELRNVSDENLPLTCYHPPIFMTLLISNTEGAVSPRADVPGRAQGFSVRSATPMPPGTTKICFANETIAAWRYKLAPGAYSIRVAWRENIVGVLVGSNTISVTVSP